LFSFILAKLLTPEIFGLIGLLNIILMISQILVIGGFGTALVQRKNISNEDINSIFLFNLVVAFSIFILLNISSTWISKFFDISNIHDYIFYYSIILLLSSLGVVPRALLAKDLNYKRIAQIGIFSTISSGFIAVVLAFYNFGIWSIIYQQLIYHFFLSILLLYSRRWMLKLQISLKSMRDIGAFGFKLMLAQLFNASSQGIINIILAKYFPIKDLGFYDRAYKFSNYPSVIIKKIFSNVYLSTFSKIQNEPKRMFKYFDKTMTYIYICMSPILFTIYVLSESLIHYMGENWLPMIPIFKVLLIIAIFTPLHTLNLTVLKSQGKGNYFLFIEVVKKLLLLIVIFSTFRFGIMGLVVGQVFAVFIEYFINSWYANKFFMIKWHYQLKLILINFFPVILVITIFELLLKPNNSLIFIFMYLFTGWSMYCLWIFSKKSIEIKELLLLINKRFA
jgi:O-antigen/teichoic acid export membrane protein